MRSPWHHHPGVRTGDKLTRGEKAADWVRNKMGSWGFVGGFLIFMGLWAIFQSIILATHAFDKYPYILLNLFLSMLAGLQGAILLIAAKRADAVAAEQALHHLTISQDTAEAINLLIQNLGENSATTSAVHQLAQEIHDLVQSGRDDNEEPSGDRG